MIQVKVIQMPGLIRDVQVADNALAGDAIRAAGINNLDGYTIKVNGLEANANTSLADGSSVIVSQGAKGNN